MSSAVNRSPGQPGSTRDGQRDDDGVGRAREVQLRQQHRAQQPVHRREQVERAEQRDGDRGGAPRAAAVRAGVEADQHVRQPHRAQRRRHQHRPGAEQRVPGRARRRAAGAARSRCRAPPRRRSAAPPRRPGTPSVLRPPPCAVPARAARAAPPSIRTVTGSVSSKRVSRVKSTAVGAVNRVNSTGCSGLVAHLRAHARPAATAPGREQHQLERELERLDVGRRAHAAQRQRHAHHDAGHDHADPVRRAADQRQHLAGRRELRHQVQVADHQHDQRAQPAQHRGAEPGLGEVGDGQRAGAPHRAPRRASASAGSPR